MIFLEINNQQKLEPFQIPKGKKGKRLEEADTKRGVASLNKYSVRVGFSSG